MRKRLVPALALFVAVMLDTTLVPMFFPAVWVVPLSLALVLCIGASQGRYVGLVAGLASGLLIDVLVGYPLGLRLFEYMGAGFLCGLIVPLPPATLKKRGFDLRLLLLRLALFTLAYQLLTETAVGVYQYFNTARYAWTLVGNALVRVALTTALSLALLVPLRRIARDGEEETPVRQRKEARHF